MQRTPPEPVKGQLCISESDVNRSEDSEGSTVSINSRRQKRKLNTNSDTTKPHWAILFEDEIKGLLKEWKSEQDRALKKLSVDVGELKKQNLEIYNTNVEIQKAMDFLSTQYEALKTKVEENTKELVEKENYIKTLEYRIDNLERYTNYKVIEIRNVPLQPEENVNHLRNVIKNIFEVSKVEYRKEDLNDVYRIKTKTKNGPIIAHLSSTTLKNSLLKSIRKYNKENPENKFNSRTIGYAGEPTPIYISERLNEKTKKIFYLTRKFAKDNRYTYCWSTNGRVFIKKSEGSSCILIKDEGQLNLLKAAI